ncbi:hypothetical protein V4V36_26870 [Paenibacillus lautus]|uniref:hypothetical protein n=1 Tax=Paenibacillus lautus TaxID=1401 RepID=UPI002FBD37B7
MIPENEKNLPSALPDQSETSTLHWWKRWPEWVPYATIIWTLAYGALGLYWWAGGLGFPLGLVNDPGAAHSLFRQATAADGGLSIACLCLLGALAILLLNRKVRGITRAIMLLYAWSAAMVLCFAIPDPRALIGMAYGPVSLIGALFGQSLHYLDFFIWPVVNQYICLLGGLLWAASALIYQRHTRDACRYCGRSNKDHTLWQMNAVARLGRWATYAAILAPLYYDITRIAWLFGIPFGITNQMLYSLQASGADWAGAGLALVSIGGAFLTHGLIKPWGETFPRWFPILGGQRVPPAVAVLPAGFVAILLTVTGIQVVNEFPMSGDFQNWGATTPLLFMPIWGIALGTATICYYYRRQEKCRQCT